MDKPTLENTIAVRIEDQATALRRRSGEVDSDDPLVSFLYLLLRDKLPAGEIAGIVREAFSSGVSEFTNGYLAKYAKDLASQFWTHAP